MFLYFCMCRYGYVKNERKQSQNRQKRARDWKKVKSRSRGSKNDERKLIMWLKVFRDSFCYIFGPWAKFEEMIVLVPHLSEKYTNGPSKISWRKIINGPSWIRENHNIPLEDTLSKSQIQSLSFGVCTTLVLVINITTNTKSPQPDPTNVTKPKPYPAQHNTT